MNSYIRNARNGALLALFLIPACAALAQAPDPPDPTPIPTPTPGRQGRGGGFAGRGGGGAAGVVTLRPYADIVTSAAKTEKGVFIVHRIDDRILYEIPPKMLGREMLFTSEIEQLPANVGYGGTAVGSREIRWTRRNNRVYLRLVNHSVRAEGATGGIAAAIADATLEPIAMEFDVEAEGEDKAPVIDVSRLFTTDPTEFQVKNALGGGGVDAARSYIEKVKAFPTNIETKSMLTFTAGGGGFALGDGPTPTPTPGPRRRPAGGGGGRRGGGTVTALIHYSMVALPEVPMAGRLGDSRLGFFSENFQDYGRPEHRVVDREYIARFRMEKKDPKAAISDPIKPIVFYVSREVPDKWRPALHRAVEAWQVAFEEAGFSHAIICKDAPSVAEDPNWDPEDARYSVIRWAPTPTENAQGPHTSDPRSGEIISAHVIVWHNVLKLAETWYFTQVGPLDPRARVLPLPDELMSELMQYVVCHEIGHTLGLEHNFKASSAYTCQQLRSRAFTEQYGDEASIMDYGRFNYVAQPGDNCRLIPMIGPYDKFAIKWGYTPIPNCKTPDDEKHTLDDMASAQVGNPMLRFGHGPEAGSTEDPTEQMEDLGSDPVEATRLGLKNISRVCAMLVPATCKFGEDYSLLGEMYEQMLAQRTRELGHVSDLVGGVVEADYHAGRGGDVYKFVTGARQKGAVRFLLDNLFQTPKDIILPDVLHKIGPGGVADRIVGNQQSILLSLLSEARIKRLVDQQALAPADCYTVTQLVTDMRNGIWSELAQPHPVIDVYRRNLQRVYINDMKPILVGDTASTSELRPATRGALEELQQTLNGAISRTTDRETLMHLRDCRITIDRILNPKS